MSLPFLNSSYLKEYLHSEEKYLRILPTLWRFYLREEKFGVTVVLIAYINTTLFYLADYIMILAYLAFEAKGFSQKICLPFFMKSKLCS